MYNIYFKKKKIVHRRDKERKKEINKRIKSKQAKWRCHDDF